METFEIFTIVSIAFLGSFGHCIGMCGGIVVAYSTIKINPKSSKISQSGAHLLYSLGRVSTYMVIGAIFGALGSVSRFSNSANGGLLVFAGVVMVLAGLSLMGKIKFLSMIEHTISTSSFYKTYFQKILSSDSKSSFYLLGLLNGLLPCGFIYFFAITAASTASAFYGALVMAIFGLSTIPALFSMGFLTSLASATSFRKMMMSLSSIAVILYGVYTVYNGYKYITTPQVSVLHCH